MQLQQTEVIPPAMAIVSFAQKHFSIWPDDFCREIDNFHYVGRTEKLRQFLKWGGTAFVTCTLKIIIMAQLKSSGRSGSRKTKETSSGVAAGNTQLEKFFEDSLKDIYWAENHLVKALAKMQKKATTEELQSAIEEHIAQTKEHVSRLDQVFKSLGKKPQAKKCEAMEGLIKEGESVVEETEDGSMTRDVGIIVSAQKVEHYEIAAYGSLRQLAMTMGQDEIAEILSQTLEEEKQTDQTLTQIAENNINWEAEQEVAEEK
jgi:ferritin-like metal-binding protein YciE